MALSRNRTLVATLAALLFVQLASGPAASHVKRYEDGGGSDGGGSGGSTAATQRYTFRSTLDYATGELVTDQTLEWTNRGESAVTQLDLSVLPQALGILTLGSITADGQPTTNTWTTSTNLRVTLPQPLQPDATARLEIPFTLDITGGTGFRGRIARQNGVVNFGSWFPIWSREHDIYGIGDPQVSHSADVMRLELTSTTDLGADAVVSSGRRVSATDRSWVFEATNVRDFAFAVSPSFDFDNATVTCRDGGQTYTTQVIVATSSVSAATVSSLAVSALRRMNGWYGCYPWPTLSLAESAVVEGAEYPTMILLDPIWATNRYIIDHEVAHQWWYAAIGNDQIDEPWIDEAWAQFSAHYGLGLRFSSCSTRNIDLPTSAWRPGAWLGKNSYIETVYFRGGVFLNALRQRMGTGAFFAAARRFIDENRYGLVTGEQLLDAFRDATSANLEPIISNFTGNSSASAQQRIADRPAPQSGPRQGQDHSCSTN
jgi:hypothetical protein